MIDGKTTVCCIIGDPVEHSFSPVMHNAAYAETGLNYAYVAFPVKDVPSAVAGIRALNIRGSSVTIPHKVTVMDCLDELDPVAEWIGSVNTIINDKGVLKGRNTDGAGAMKALTDAGAPLAGSKVLMLGSGGGARAIAFTLAARGGIGALKILGVVEEELSRLAEEVGRKTGTDTQWAMMNDETLKSGIADADLVVHCTPVGMHPQEGQSVVPAEYWCEGLWVMDIVYNPRETRLLQEAKAAGCNVVYGLEMLLNQGVLQFEAWTGEKAPAGVMRRALEEGLSG